MHVNGKNVQVFMEQDLPEIHRVVENVKSGGKALNLKVLNEFLIEQLNKLLSGFTAVDSDTSDANLKKIKRSGNEGDTQCLKCDRPCRKKAIFCTEGSHWIHYYCERLSSEEIKTNENSCKTDPEGRYMCKICQSKSTTNEKTTRRLALPPVELKRSPSSAELILEEESCDDKSNRKAMNRNWSNQKSNPALKTKAGNK